MIDPRVAVLNMETLERELVAARATLAEHVEENLALHARCNELEAENARLEASHRATEELLLTETELRRKLEARMVTVQLLLDRAHDDDVYVREARKASRG